ncbi:MAG: DUF2281 domain-containing protein [Eggerthellaceae bacterium]|nr:DUF2281 domain-containing protein [Eggerthellaceae bacterium]MDR2715229.1 DUF2281 domain-containing protein [Coriobacteriaceae bacterium]
MTESQLLEVVRQLPPNKAQEVYDFALFLSSAAGRSIQRAPNKRIEGFSSEAEMLDYANDIGKIVYAD